MLIEIVNHDGSRFAHDVRELVVDGCRFSPEFLAGLAKTEQPLIIELQRVSDVLTVSRVEVAVWSRPATMLSARAE